MSCHMFFFNKKIAYSSSISAFIVSVSNSIMKLAVFRFSCLKNSILHSVSAAFVLSLNVVLISLTVSGVVHTGVEVCRMDSEMSGLVK